MAETSTSNRSNAPSSDGSPISNLAPDHLFSILLLLPVDSIVSFSMTCKKFRTLACSDALWESICRREWGPTSVDALKPSDYREGGLPWMKLYNRVLHLESVACHNLSEMGGGEMLLPSPRASHTLNFVSDCLVLFGGGCEGGRHLDDTWVAYIGKDFRRRLKWQRVNSGSPSGRFGHTCVVIGDFLVLFGGINDLGNRQNDTWVGKVALHETLGITLLWRLLDVGSVVPPARGAHAACCIDDRKMVVHGGIELYGLRLGDTWVLELSENFCLGRWHEVVTHPSPPACSGHSLTCIGGSRTVLFGGRGLGYEVLNDVWLLDLSEGNGTWVQLFYELSDIPEGVCLPRVGHSANLVLGGRLLIHGGEDSYRHRKNDFWVLDIKAIASSVRFQPIQANSWKRLNSKGYKPNGRSFHRACADHSGRYLYIYGGMVDGLIQPAESPGLRFDGELFLAELMLQL
ncbi:F-box/kelch-repeat protein At1g51550 [Syzygium oleosum]|uniref:F-box/kelch-repeat protein At1g51550 n=1 Tax=Syzygium oleosum TaxID=219896 RepID=UPI0011D2678C|nr:F-box/kelch-repeat protein At1g51550 [Syzygium oleosum]